MFRITRWVAVATFALMAGGPSLAADGAYPERRISIIVAATPGNANDLLARTVARRLSERLKQPVVVENRPGGGGTIGAGLLVQAKPDGYTLMVQSTSLTTAQVVYKTPGFDVERDFAPVVMLGLAPMGVFVNSAMPVNTIAEFVAYAKKNPDKINFGSSGSGGIMHINAERFALETGIQAVHVPYTGGAPAVTALMAGDIQMLIVDIASGLAGLRSGKLKLLAVGAPTRVASMPNVPTTSEAGLSFDPAVWYGLFAPAATPPAVQKILQDEMALMVADPAYRA
ncbi:MAG: tripartite tricarboxylate transporter substrate-binding protein, partial [Desulfobacterales bacterium]|nr:tripartite tricarboxylate transporter substrate-binding protein [Desulfobacterales bacterium]